MATQPTTTPAVGYPVVITAGPPYEQTWDDSGDLIVGVEGTLTEILEPEWVTRYVVRTADAQILYAFKVRVVDDAYRAEQAAEEELVAQIAVRRRELLETALDSVLDDPAITGPVRDRLAGIAADAQHQARAETTKKMAECPTCGAPAVGSTIPEHRPGSPCTVDYRVV